MLFAFGFLHHYPYKKGTRIADTLERQLIEIS